MNGSFLKEGWEDGPTRKRDLKGPAKLKRDPILTQAMEAGNLALIVAWELAVVFCSFLKRVFWKPEPKSLKGRVCLVTGAGRGLGRELCLALAKEGAVIACADINEPNNITTAEMVKELGVKVIPYTVNVAIKKDTEDLVSKVEKDLGPIYLLINNAAVVYIKPRIDEEFLRASFNVNVYGPVWLMNAVLPTMKLRNEGHIVNICSVTTKLVASPLNVYGASKTALNYLSNCLRVELQLENNNNIFVTTVHPSLMNSSEDYVTFMSTKVNMFIEMKSVVKATMKAIHYNYDEVYIPSFAKYLLLVIDELPTQILTKLTRYFTVMTTLLNEDQERLLPWNDLIKKCSFVENTKGH